MNADFWVEWEQLFEAIAEDPEIRAVVCSASGEKMFSAGIDLAQVKMVILVLFCKNMAYTTKF